MPATRMNAPIAEWNAIFAPEGSQAAKRRFLMVQRSGQPLLLLPTQRRLAAQCMTLYPAQTGKAKMAKQLLQSSLRLGIPVPLRTAELPVEGSSPVVKFLSRKEGFPEFGVFLGNPNVSGRRIVVLAFEHGRPSKVVKVGTGGRAEELIERELRFLESAPAGLPGLPPDIARVPDIAAFAMSYVPGQSSPILGAEGKIGVLLGGWLRDEKQSLSANPVWQRARDLSRRLDAMTSIENNVGSVPFAVSTMHGDFCPWNVRVSNGKWTVLDWERGEHFGIPGWDWFHYVVQSNVLVRKSSAADVLESVRAVFRNRHFQSYAAAAGIVGRESAFFKAYLLYITDVVRPTEGLSVIQELFDQASEGRAGAR